MEVTNSKLQTVIRIKNLVLKKQQRELSEISSIHQKENDALEELEQTHHDAMNDAGNEMKTKAQDVQVNRAFIQHLSRQIKQQVQRVEEIDARETQKREEIFETSQSKRMVEELEDRRNAEKEKETERKTQRLIDVLAQRLQVNT
jgi:flagellar export protein FliJ